RNSDLLLHLAAGRRVASGEWRVASVREPINHRMAPLEQTWLYDLVSYELYEGLGGAGLVCVKALLVIGLGLVLLRLSRTDSGWWIPAACTALALLAMGLRLPVQPATV